MKMTKNDLKLLIKECLLEVLAEGINGTSYSQKSNAQQFRKVSTQQNKKTVQENKKRFNPMLDTVTTINDVFEDVNSSFDSNVGDIASSNAISDIQSSTMQEHFKGDVEDIFGSSTINVWSRIL